jgi:hypothetical protein
MWHCKKGGGGKRSGWVVGLRIRGLLGFMALMCVGCICVVVVESVCQGLQEAGLCVVCTVG